MRCPETPLEASEALTALCYPRPGPTCGSRPLELRAHGVESLCAPERGVLLPGGMRVLGKGHAGVVLLARSRWGLVALKVLRLDGKRGDLSGEARLQSIASRAGAAPPVYAWGRWFIISGLVEGPRLEDLPRPLPGWAVLEALRAARALDAAGVLHAEISRPWRSVIFTSQHPGSRALIVDYESAGRGCGNVPKILSGLALRHKPLMQLLATLRPLLRRYKSEGCPLSVYREVEALVARALGYG
jgi:putative serine/threonine protein kinase